MGTLLSTLMRRTRRGDAGRFSRRRSDVAASGALLLLLLPPLLFLQRSWRGIRDKEAFIAKMLPVHFAHWLRKSRAFLRAYDFATTFLLAAGLAVGRPALALRHFFPTLRVSRDLRYSVASRSCVCDVYCKKDNEKKVKPAVIFVHGGVWTHGSKFQYRLVGEQLAEQGFVVMVGSYRTYPEGNSIDMAGDVVSMLKFWAEHAGSFQSSITKTVLLSHSSGAHICSLALMSNSAAAARIGGAAFLNGVFDVKAHYEFEKARGVHEISMLAEACDRKNDINFRHVSVTNLVPFRNDSRLPPILLVHGFDDNVVPFHQSETFASALRKRGQPCTVRIFHATHASPLLACILGNIDDPAMSQIVRWARNTAKRSVASDGEWAIL